MAGSAAKWRTGKRAGKAGEGGGREWQGEGQGAEERKGITPQNETNNTEKAYEMALERNVAGEWAQYEQGGRGEDEG